ncbi:GntP family permease [Nesterenkonia sandarakina]|uniref:GntP family gluconate:H+ symporter n=1 Tax=Nesterenkonia sandarakina TaxID=272918 RepID=A0A7Z0J2W2_9MICC|nr:gluconate:H+ symporter [Nesterenkonia sandarakina]NYJ16700.1 GntP family gluconate:H+ symporter [Nesterenkonia sandarakina]
MTETMGSSELAAIIGLAAAVALLIFFVLRTKIHAVLALIIAASIAGLAAGMAPDEVIDSITTGFGSTLATIGLVIGLGVMMGRILEVSGAAEKLAYTLIRWLGKKKEEWALAGAGFIISIPIFVDSAYVILSPLVKSLSRTTGRSILTLGISLAGGLILTHHAVPPTPGPLGAAGIFGVSIGEMILWGIILTLPALFLIVLYAKIMGPRIEAMIEADTGEALTPTEAFDEFQVRAEEREKQLPSLFLAILPILLPIVLIFFNTLSAYIADAGILDLPATLVSIAAFIGNPVIALLAGVLVAIYGLTRRQSRQGTLDDMEHGVQAAGIILLVTGAGGALGAVLRDSGTGDSIGAWVAGLPLPTIMIPFLIATVVRIIQGSGTVAIITAASISAPILAQVPDVNMVLAAQAAALGSLFFGYFNDSFFWVVNRMLGVKNAKHQMLVWSIPTTIGWATTLVMLLIASAIF